MRIEFAKKRHDTRGNTFFREFVKKIETNDREIMREIAGEKRYDDTFTPVVYDRRIQLKVMNEIPDYDMVNSDIIIDRDDPLIQLCAALARYKTTNQFALNLSTKFVTYDDEQGRFDTLRRCKALYDRLSERLDIASTKFGYTTIYKTDYTYILKEIRTSLKLMVKNISFAIEAEGAEISNKNLFFLTVAFINNVYRAYEGFRRLVVPEFVFGLLKGNVEELNFYRFNREIAEREQHEEILELKNVEKDASPKMVTRKTFVNKEIDLSLNNGVYNGMLFAELCDRGIIRQGSNKLLYRTKSEKDIITELKEAKIELANGKNTAKIGVNRIQAICKEHKVHTMRDLKKAQTEKSFFLTNVETQGANYFTAAQHNFKLRGDSKEVLNDVNSGIADLVSRLSEEPGKGHYKNYFRACFYNSVDESVAAELNTLNNQIIREVHENYRNGRGSNDIADNVRYRKLEDRLLQYGLSESELIGLNEPLVDETEEYDYEKIA